MLPLIKSFFRRRIGALDLGRIYPSYDYVSNVAIFGLARNLLQAPENIERVCVVGVHDGDEAPKFLRLHPKAHVHLYEPSARYVPKLRRRFEQNARVTLRPVAASDTAGHADFFENNRHGDGSLLEVGTQGRALFGLKPAETTKVETVRLDDDFPDNRCDCLWIDVQGAEMMVLRGAENLLRGTGCIHIEVSAHSGFYQGDRNV
ncbi:nodulation protein [Candidatus Rhodobacter oscarellae]|uniref:Nodulation protein n=1 Tax=Candidatus Rhodobacter oscarellae TaxID=1675527 RepID=A0A0J9E2D1_9RHOB|nr:FkbM family methyltransferase [Candidatus Rhodobacter lobularis]KMW56847.1 nodulation protein [Candidatus Rhodobacter lobularis]